MKDINSIEFRPFVVKMDTGASDHIWRWKIPNATYAVPPQPSVAEGIVSKVDLRSRTVSESGAVVFYDPTIPDSLMSVQNLTALDPELGFNFTKEGLILSHSNLTTPTLVSGPEYHISGRLALRLLGFPSDLINLLNETAHSK